MSTCIYKWASLLLLVRPIMTPYPTHRPHRPRNSSDIDRT